MAVHYPVLSTDPDSPPLPDPTGAPDGQVPTTASGAYVLAVAVALSDATPAALGTASPGVSTEASRADHVHEAPAGGVDTSLQAAPDTGWTAAGDGTA